MADLLYPPIGPYDGGLLDVGDGNRVYWEVCGTPTSKPLIAAPCPTKDQS